MSLNVEGFEYLMFVVFEMNVLISIEQGMQVNLQLIQVGRGYRRSIYKNGGSVFTCLRQRRVRQILGSGESNSVHDQAQWRSQWLAIDGIGHHRLT